MNWTVAATWVPIGLATVTLVIGAPAAWAHWSAERRWAAHIERYQKVLDTVDDPAVQEALKRRSCELALRIASRYAALGRISSPSRAAGSIVIISVTCSAAVPYTNWLGGSFFRPIYIPVQLVMLFCTTMVVRIIIREAIQRARWVNERLDARFPPPETPDAPEPTETPDAPDDPARKDRHWTLRHAWEKLVAWTVDVDSYDEWVDLKHAYRTRTTNQPLDDAGAVAPVVEDFADQAVRRD